MSTPCEAFVQQMLGVWEGTGKMEFPTLPNIIDYEARLTLSKVPEKTKMPFTHTNLSTWKSGTKRGMGMHYDQGFMKCVSGTTVEWVLAHNPGFAEVLTGEVEGTKNNKATFNSLGFSNVEELLGSKRVLEIQDNGAKLIDTFFMKTVSVPTLTKHLETTYAKQK
eukprot:PhF_6_TR39805/c0_g1_i1/m.59194